MRAGARLGWRFATAVVFGATAALAVMASRGAPMDASLVSAKGGAAVHVTASASPAVPRQCATSRLRVSMGPGVLVAAVVRHGSTAKARKPGRARPAAAKRGNAAVAALIRYRLDFTNVSHLPCTMAGYPQVTADRNGVLVGGAAAHDTSAVAHRLLLAPGQTVHAALDAAAPTAHCRLVRASGLRVAPPGQSSARYLRRPLTTCTASGRIYLHVHAVQAGEGAPEGGAAAMGG